VKALGEVCGLCKEGEESGRALGIVPLHSGFAHCSLGSGVLCYGEVPHSGKYVSPDGGPAGLGVGVMWCEDVRAETFLSVCRA